MCVLSLDVLGETATVFKILFAPQKFAGDEVKIIERGQRHCSSMLGLGCQVGFADMLMQLAKKGRQLNFTHFFDNIFRHHQLRPCLLLLLILLVSKHVLKTLISIQGS